jgi:hypothetical protein
MRGPSLTGALGHPTKPNRRFRTNSGGEGDRSWLGSAAASRSKLDRGEGRIMPGATPLGGWALLTDTYAAPSSLLPA